MKKAFCALLALTSFVFVGVTTTMAPTAVEARPNHHLLGQSAPNWVVTEWLNGNPGDLVDHRGKVVVIDFFQLWCPGCKAFSMPLMEQWENQTFAREYANDQIEFISIHTVFEGRDYQTPERLRAFIKERGITHPVGNDRHIGGEKQPITMQFYGTRGTPEIAIIGKDGKVRFQEFGFFEPGFGETTIRALLNE